MYVKIHRSGNRFVVAVCDEDLMGKTFTDKDRQLKISKHFYKGEKKSEEEVVKLLKTCGNANLVGEQSIKAGINAGVIKKENVMIIGGVQHAQIISI
jgi:uncharacterized protein